jgi:hypothetical protein
MQMHSQQLGDWEAAEHKAEIERLRNGIFPGESLPSMRPLSGDAEGETKSAPEAQAEQWIETGFETGGGD